MFVKRNSTDFILMVVEELDTHMAEDRTKQYVVFS